MRERNREFAVQRRRALQLLGVGGGVTLAGCLGAFDEDAIEVTSANDRTRAEVADHLESIAERLRSGDELALDLGDETIAIRPPESLSYEIEIEDERVDGDVEREVEFQFNYTRTDEEEPLTEDGF